MTGGLIAWKRTATRGAVAVEIEAAKRGVKLAAATMRGPSSLEKAMDSDESGGFEEELAGRASAIYNRIKGAFKQQAMAKAL